MKIVVAVRCYNEQKHIERFMKGYEFADQIVVSDGGSTDDSVSILRKYEGDKVKVIEYGNYEIVAGHRWNPDAMHMNYVLNAAKELKPDWLIFDDMDDVPNIFLRENARDIIEKVWEQPQINAFRLYLWGDTGKFFPKMNNNFDINYVSLWAWSPKVVDIKADENIRHGTLVGLFDNPFSLVPPYCLLHKSWYPETVDAKVERYNKLGLPTQHPFEYAGELADLPEWAVE